MSEKAIQEGLQDSIQAMTAFADADVVINDWGVLDQSSSNAPYVIIENSDDFESVQDTSEPVTVWNIPITLVEAFSDWDTSLNNLRTRRQALVDQINSGSARSAGGLEATNVRRISNDGPISQIYDRYLRPNEEAEALPVFLSQRMIFEVEEF